MGCDAADGFETLQLDRLRVTIVPETDPRGAADGFESLELDRLRATIVPDTVYRGAADGFESLELDRLRATIVPDAVPRYDGSAARDLSDGAAHLFSFRSEILPETCTV